MISIIICSRSEQIDKHLINNIRQTIGVPYEIIIIDNSANKYSIFQAYNIGLKKSQGTILCFMHDDIFFHTNDWGLKVLNHFEDEETGAIGVAGTPYAAKMPGSWWGGGLVYQQLVRKQEDRLIEMTKHIKDQYNGTQEVILLDGIWLCVSAALFKKISFDEKNFMEFHFYDIDICLQIYNCGYKLYCVYDIFIEHFSKGNINKAWIKNSVKLNNKWNNELPLSCLLLSKAEKKGAEISTIREFFEILFSGVNLDRSAFIFALKKCVLNRTILFSSEFANMILKYITRYFSYLINPNKKHERNLQ